MSTPDLQPLQPKLRPLRLGEQQIWADYNDHGDADVYGTISHEMGHRIQQVANAHNPNPDVPNEEIQAYVKRALTTGAVDQQIRALDVGKTNVDIAVVHRGKLAAPAAQSVAERSGLRPHGQRLASNL